MPACYRIKELFMKWGEGFQIRETVKNKRKISQGDMQHIQMIISNLPLRLANLSGGVTEK